jgi:hypothetical protein
MTALVATVLDLTDGVQAAIESGDWPRAQELETERRRLLEQMATAPGDAGARRGVFADLETRNHRLIGLVEHHQRRVLREAAVARTAHDGVAAYADVRRAAAETA